MDGLAADDGLDAELGSWVADALASEVRAPPCAPTLDMAYPPEDADGEDKDKDMGGTEKDPVSEAEELRRRRREAGLARKARDIRNGLIPYPEVTRNEATGDYSAYWRTWEEVICIPRMVVDAILGRERNDPWEREWGLVNGSEYGGYDWVVKRVADMVNTDGRAEQAMAEWMNSEYMAWDVFSDLAELSFGDMAERFADHLTADDPDTLREAFGIEEHTRGYAGGCYRWETARTSR